MRGCAGLRGVLAFWTAGAVSLRLGLKPGFRHGTCWGLTSLEGGGEVPGAGPFGGRVLSFLGALPYM